MTIIIVDTIPVSQYITLIKFMKVVKYLNLYVIVLSAIDCVMSAIYRGLYRIIKFGGDYTNPIWWTLMLFTAAINVTLLYKIQNSKRHFTCVNLEILIGVAIYLILSMIYDKLDIVGVSIYWIGVFMYDGLYRDTVLYIIQTCIYIFV